MEPHLNHLNSPSQTFVGSTANLISKGIHSLTITPTWTPMVTLVRQSICDMFEKIKFGTLKVVFTNGESKTYGQPNTGHDVTLTIFKDQFWIRCALYSDLGFGEAYMNEECDVSHRTQFLQLLIRNRKYIEGTKSIASQLVSGLNYLINTKFANTITNSVNNISAHYDLGNEMFNEFLDSSMTYSCPIWDPADPKDDLHKAQLRKLHHIIKKAKLVKSDHLLEIGSGWGSLAIEAASLTGCRVTTLTLSIEQKVLAERRIKEAGLSHLITVLLCDYRKLNPREKFDKIISIEMIEAVGKEYLETYFESCDHLLKEEGGIMVFQSITVHENRYERYSNSVDFIQKYIFPGGHAPSITMLINSIYLGTKGMLIVDNLENIGAHYTKALRLWSDSFTKAYPKINQVDPKKYNEVFKRCWQHYFSYCETGFSEHLLGTVQIVLTRPKNKLCVEGVPL